MGHLHEEDAERPYVDDFEDDEFEDDEDQWECQFPGNCCMPFDHSRDECHTPEMAEEYFKQELAS